MFKNFILENREQDVYIIDKPSDFDALTGSSNLVYQMHGIINAELQSVNLIYLDNTSPLFILEANSIRLQQNLYDFTFLIDKLKLLRIIGKDNFNITVLFIPRIEVSMGF